MDTGNQESLLVTKILLPQSADALVIRPRLLDQIAEIQAKRLTVVKAPAGFGKTSTTTAWAQHLIESGYPVAWLALDTDDDEPTRFLFYVCHALGRACDDIGNTAVDLIHERSLLVSTTIVTALINDLTNIGDEIYLFLDDYHWITDPAIHNTVSFLLKHAPPNFHMVLATRSEPFFTLSRLRALNQLLEIDAAALCFDLDETRHFLEHEHIATLDTAELKILHAKTEGWPAVLRIIASIFTRSEQDLGCYVRRLSGAGRPIDIYLADMLEELPHDLVEFMLKTAILDRLCVSLCEAVTGSASSRELLETIAVRRLLLLPLDPEALWYRYHSLIAEYLRHSLNTCFLQEIPELHRRAYRWYAAHGSWTDAIQHAIAAGDTDRALSWIGDCAMMLVRKGDLLTLLGWQRQFPTELMKGQTRVRLAIAWGMALAMRFDDGLKLLTEIEADVDPGDTPESRSLRCECQSIRSALAALQDDSQTALPLAEACLRRQPADPWTMNVASNVARFGYWKAGELESFHAVPWTPEPIDDHAMDLFTLVYRLCLKGLVEVQQLQLGEGERYYREGMTLAERYAGPNTVAAALPASLVALVRYQQGRLDEAEALVIDRIPIIDATGMLECVLSAYMVLARTAAWRRHVDRAHVLLEQMERLGHARRWGRLVAAALVEQLRLHRSEGKLMESRACVRRLDHLAAQYPAMTRCAWSDIHHYAIVASAFLATSENRWDDAVMILKRLRRQAEIAQHPYFALHLAAQLSVALRGANKTAEAFEVFSKVLTMSAAAGIHQVILDLGAPAGPLLTDFAENGRHSETSTDLQSYVQGLITDLYARYTAGPQPGAPSPSAGIEPLSPRERDIVALIAQGQSNKEIARQLGITPETVKSHIKNIFIKLKTEKRAQAVSRAQNLGLISTSL
jgi:LuxR family maltose regulon positive regulatory protein